MDPHAALTPREEEMAELLAWGAARKEVADRLSVSTKTVEATARNIYRKIGIQKATELCVWWFCTRCGVSFNLSPLRRGIIAGLLVFVLLPDILLPGKDLYRAQRAKTKTESARGARPRRDGDGDGDGGETYRGFAF